MCVLFEALKVARFKFFDKKCLVLYTNNFLFKLSEVEHPQFPYHINQIVFSMKHTLLKRLLVILFLFLSFSFYSQQRSITVKDSLTNEPLPFANINLLNGFGLFTDDAGKVQLSKETPNTIKISYVGYFAKTVIVDQIKVGTILLQPDINALKEVTVVAPKATAKKRKEFTVKPLIHDDINRIYWSSIGQQYAFFIPSTKKNGLLQSVTLPVIVKDLHQGITETSFESDPYGTLVKFEFMTSVNQLPGKKHGDYEKKVIIHSGKVKEQVRVDFEEEVEIPEEGIFVVMTIIGKTNKQDIYVPEMPYATVNLPDRTKKIIKIILPNYPLVEAPKGQLTLFRNVFSDIEKWETIKKPMVYKKEKEDSSYNIGIGYTYSGY